VATGRIISGKYAGHRGTVENNGFQKAVDYLDEWANGHHLMLDTEKLVRKMPAQPKTLYSV
jgi:hypothetical protein